MKKLLMILGIALMMTVCSCDNNTDDCPNITTMLYYKQVTIDEHKYIVFSRRGGGVSAIHAESCECKNININKED